MFCPFCKAEYRAGVTRCSDCNFPLVDVVPLKDSDPNFMVLLWNGESLELLEAVCVELDKAAIPVAVPSVDVLLRDSTDRYHLKSTKTFPFVMGVRARDFAAARNILETVAQTRFPKIQLPPAAAYPRPFDERKNVAHHPRSSDAPLDATVAVYSSEDLRSVEFLEASFDVVSIPFRRMPDKTGAYETQVRPQDEVAALQVVEEIARGTSSQTAAAVQEDALLQDKPPSSHFLAWFTPIFWILIWIVATAEGSINATPLAVLLFMGGFLYWGGMFWMAHQADRYEPRSFKYYVAALIPLAFVWYYVERVMGREGLQKLPVSVRARKLPPQT